MAAETACDAPQDLAHRVTDGLEVTPFWHPGDDRLTVTVTDSRLGDAFELPAACDRGLEVFHRPFSYAARCGIDYGPPAVEIEETADV